MVLHRAVQKGAADIIGIKTAGSYLLAESVRKWMAFFSAQDESCQHPAQKIITAGRKAYSQSNESCQVVWQHLRTNAVPDIRYIGGFGFWPRPELGCISSFACNRLSFRGIAEQKPEYAGLRAGDGLTDL